MNRQVKLILKEARECFSKENFERAKYLSEQVLYHDKDNYVALIIYGSSNPMENPKKALTALHRAVEIHPDQIQGYKALISFYERNLVPDSEKALIDIYPRIIDHYESGDPKKLEAIDKLISLCKNNGELLKGINASFLAAEESPSTSDIFFHLRTIISLVKINQLDNELLFKAFELLFVPRKIEKLPQDFFDHYIEYIKLLRENDMQEKAISVAHMFKAAYSRTKLPIKLLIELKMEQLLGAKPESTEFRNLGLAMAELEPGSNFIIIANAMILYLNNNIHEAVKQLIESLSSERNFTLGWYFVAQFNIQLHQFEKADKHSSIALNNLESILSPNLKEKLTGNLYLILTQALAGQKLWDDASKILEKATSFLEKNLDKLLMIGRIYLDGNQIEKAEKIAKIAKSKAPDSPSVIEFEAAKLLYLQRYEEAKDMLDSLINENLPLTNHLLGRYYWENNHKQEAIVYFKKACTLDPFYSRNYFYFGCYSKQKGDIEKTKECFEGALALNPNDVEAAKFYYDFLVEIDDESSIVRILKQLADRAYPKSLDWVHSTLGIYLYNQQKYEDSLNYLKQGVMLQPEDSFLWTCLGDAYYYCECYASAYKVFERSIELGTTSLYPFYRLGCIESMLEKFLEAIERHKMILDENYEYFPAYAGLVDAYLSLIKRKIDGSLFESAKDLIEDALEIFKRALSIFPSKCLFWSALGDLCEIAFELSDSYYPLEASKTLSEICIDETLTNLTRDNILKIGNNALRRCLHAAPNSIQTWRSLALNYMNQANLVTEREKESISDDAFNCIKKAVELDPEDADLWNLFGVICLKHPSLKLPLAQHAFFQCVSLDNNNVSGWSNLGNFLLENQSDKSKCEIIFKHAQCLDIEFSNTWIGRGRYAELLDSNKLFEFYLQATLLFHHPLSLLSYSFNICKLLLNPSKNEKFYEQHGIQHANDCLIRFLSNNKNHIEGLVLHSIIQERLGHLKGALSTSQKAYEILNASDPFSENARIAKNNYIRILCSTNHLQQALELSSTVDDEDFNAQCQKALIYFKLEDYKKSYETYQQASELDTTEEDQPLLLVSVAIVASKILDQNISRKLFMQYYEIMENCGHSIIALYAHSIKYDDEELLEIAENRLEHFIHQPKFMIKIVTLRAISAMKKGDQNGCRKLFQSMLRSYPLNSQLWHLYAKYLFYMRDLGKIPIVCEIANNLNSQTNYINSLCYLSSGKDVVKCFKEVKNAIRNQPDNIMNWVTLLSNFFVVNNYKPHVMKCAEPIINLCISKSTDENILNWLKLMKILSYIITEKNEAAQMHITEIGDSKYADGLRNIMNPCDLNETTCGSFYTNWILIANMKCANQDFNGAQEVLMKCINYSSQNNLNEWKYPTLLRLMLNSFKALQANSTEQNWAGNMDKFFHAVEKYNPYCQLLLFFQALLSDFKNNKKATKYYLEKIVFAPYNIDSSLANFSRGILFKIIEKEELKNLFEAAIKANDQELITAIEQRISEEDGVEH